MLVFMLSLASCGPGSPAVVGDADAAVPVDGDGPPIVIRSSQPAESESTAATVTPRLGDVDPPPTPIHTQSPTTPVQTTAPTRSPEHRDYDSFRHRPSSTACLPVGSPRMAWQDQDFLMWTPDGSAVVFTSGPRIFAVTSDGSRLWQVVDPERFRGEDVGAMEDLGTMAAFDVSANSDQIVFATCTYAHRPVGAGRADYQFELARIDLDGSLQSRLTTNVLFDNYPSWSPDGTRIAFLSSTTPGVQRYQVPPEVLGPNLHLYTMAPDGSNVQALKSELVGLDNRPPQWSPNSKVLAVGGFVNDELGAWLYTVNADGSGWLRLTEAVSGPSWSPDGTRLAFAKPDGDDVALYTIAVDGTDARRVTTVNGWRLRTAFRVNRFVDDELDPAWAQIGTVAWSPDGRHILYSCDPAICVVDLDGRLVGQAPLGPRHDEGPLQAAWSPDGSRIAISSRQPLDRHRIVLYTMDPDGGHLRVLVRQDFDGQLQSVGHRSVDGPVDVAGCAAGVAVPQPAAHSGLVQDCETLLGLRDALTGGAELKLAWRVERPVAQWEGVVVDGSPPRVTALTLKRRGLRGIIPAALAELTHLRVLELRENALVGAIPPELGRMPQLSRLNLIDNLLTGGIPPDLGGMPNLSDLWLADNHLSGPIPPELSSLAQLRDLFLSENNLTGPIPTELGQLANLQGLDLSHNQLTGSIPMALSQLDQLEVLHLRGNQFTGCIPSALSRVQGNDLSSLALPDCE